MARGKIIRWFENKQYGFIKGDDGDEVFLHIQEFRGKGDNIRVGISVEFEKVPSTKKEGGYDAKKARKVGNPQNNPDALPEFEEFCNPYTFIPTPTREGIQSREDIQSGLFPRDFKPVDHRLTHEKLQEDLWTGRLPIKMTVITPLVLLDEETKRVTSSKHYIYDVLSYLPESSFRGMLRSAYEIITNSRYCCFRNSDHLAYRMDTKEALKLIPAIIERKSDGELAARLYPGTSNPTKEGPKQGDPVYGAMLSMYYGNLQSSENTKVEPGYTPKTGDKVWAEIVLCQHEVSPRNTTDWNPKQIYQFWKVVHIWPFQQDQSTPTPTGRPAWPLKKPPTNQNRQQSFYSPTNSECPKTLVVEGYIFISNENMGNKHDERIFFRPYSEVFDITKRHQEAWRMRIQSYRDAHSKEDIHERLNGDKIADPWEKLGDKPGETAWSPHLLYEDGDHNDRWRNSVPDAIELMAGDMGYVHCIFENGKITGIEDIFPVMIPRELLPASLQPAMKIHQLSPADRLFGWVAQGKNEDTANSAYRGRIRVVCEEGPRTEIVENFDELPLTILGEPKPAQGRFYVAETSEGKAQTNGGTKIEKGYVTGKGLRGRKMYWHHRGLEAKNAQEYWKPTSEDRTQEKFKGRYQEYRRPDNKDAKQQDSQNCSITSWIKPGSVFHVTLHLHNLQSEELGALLWLLRLPENHYFRFGYGKPLGFGSIRLEIDQDHMSNGALTLAQGKEWQKYYGLLDASIPSTLKEEEYENLIQKFISSMVDAYNPLPTTETEEESKDHTQCRQYHSLHSLKNLLSREYLEKQNFDKLPFIEGFLRVLQGPSQSIPVHYPRLKPKPCWKGENFRWFVENEKKNKKCLPYVLDDDGLPYFPNAKE